MTTGQGSCWVEGEKQSILNSLKKTQTLTENRPRANLGDVGGSADQNGRCTISRLRILPLTVCEDGRRNVTRWFVKTHLKSMKSFYGQCHMTLMGTHSCWDASRGAFSQMIDGNSRMQPSCRVGRFSNLEGIFNEQKRILLYNSGFIINNLVYRI